VKKNLQFTVFVWFIVTSRVLEFMSDSFQVVEIYSEREK